MKSSCFYKSLVIVSYLNRALTQEVVTQSDANCIVNFHTVFKYEYVYADRVESDSSSRFQQDYTSNSRSLGDLPHTSISHAVSSPSDISPSMTSTFEISTNEIGSSSADPGNLDPKSTFLTLSESSQTTLESSAESNTVIISPLSKETATLTTSEESLSSSSPSSTTSAGLAVTDSYVSSSVASVTPTSSLSDDPSTSSTSTSSTSTSSSSLLASSSISSSSSSVSASSLSSFAQTYLDRHNYFRALHEDTPNLTWNDDVAQVAQNYADAYTCNGELVHSGNSLDGQSLGENLAYGYNFATAGAVDAWYDEINQYNYSDPGYSEATGHFTQLVWKSSTEVGCAYKYCGSYLGYYIVCNYLPIGNLVLVGDPSYFFEKNVMPLKS
ncbi:hypothetical protein KL906_002137 [Ogataea polymorpha]|nr:hypothetical protein KL937_001610 [Ogataea polymorpha]KAG7909381.1 hypothetical protein KL906_002137 [Ogataea polymorpha]KAG7916901.1 hypothetical protein KL927_002675 [Ogataea polymorpha]KAG7936560.1 hypothetical protein KL904_002128 [Ogataea polymorpha]